MAHAFDVDAVRIAKAIGAEVVTPRQLSLPGWRLESGRRGAHIAMTPAGPVCPEQIEAVIVRIPQVTVWDLPHIARRDQPFVAREMTATLYHWLAGLGRLACNRPSQRLLSGEIDRWPREGDHGPECDFIASPARCADVTIAGGQVMLGARCAAVIGRRFERDARLQRELAAWARTLVHRLLGVRIALEQDGRWRIVNVDGVPRFDTPQALSALRRSCDHPEAADARAALPSW